MAASPIPFTKVRGGKLYLNLPIPADLRPRFLTAGGAHRTHVVEALGTGDLSEGRKAARERQAHWELEFGRLRRGHAGELPSTLRKAHQFREALAEALAAGNQSNVDIIEGLAVDHAEAIEGQAGSDAAEHFYAIATKPERLTLLEALKGMCESPDMTEGTKAKRQQQMRDLLTFLKVDDCLPEHVTEARAVAYVEALNAGKLGHSTKQDRLSGLQTVWKYLARKRQVRQDSSPWRNHELTGKKRIAATGQGGAKRKWHDDEILKLYAAPAGDRVKHYGRPLLLELYTLGFTTGMRLDEIVSIRPRAVEEIEGGYWISVEASKTDAGVRGVPVAHAAAVAIIKRRLKAQKASAESIFPECRPGGPDDKLSWHVQKALGRDRDVLGFGSEVDFHSTRRTFLTLMDNNGADIVHVQRYVGHEVPTMMHRVYSEGASRENLTKVAKAVRYPAKLEAAFRNHSR